MKSFESCSAEVINISDEVIVISDDVIVISDSSVGNLSDVSGGECVNISVSKEGDDITPSFDFESSSKMLLPQPRTSTPLVQRSFVDAAIKRKKCECKTFFEIVLVIRS